MKLKIVSVICFLLAGSVTADAVEEGKGTIDWMNGFVTAVGYGTAKAGEPKGKAKANALRVAEASAHRALLETIEGVRIDSQTTVKNAMLHEDLIKTRVAGFIKGAVVSDVKEEEMDGSPFVTVKMKVCLTAVSGECTSKPTLSDTLKLDTFKEPPYVPPVQYPLYVPPPAQTPQPDVPPVVISQQSSYRPASWDSSKPATGVIFHLNGRMFERELLPVIVVTQADGTISTIYSVKSVNPNIIRTFGAVRYADSIEQALKIQSIGENPVIVYVEVVSRENMLVIRSQDAMVLRQTLSHGNNYLGEAKVVITHN